MDDNGTRDVAEFVNIAKDDVLAWPDVVHRTYPSTVYARMESTLKPFVEKSLAINSRLIDALNDKLGLPEGTLAAVHQPGEHCRSTARVIRAPPSLGPEGKTFLNPHTDFGSLVREFAVHVVLPILTNAFTCSPSCITASEVFKFSLQVIQNGTMSKYAL